MTTAISPVGAQQVTLRKSQSGAQRAQTGEVAFAGGGSSARLSNNSNKLGVLGWAGIIAAGCCALPLLVGAALSGFAIWALFGRKALAAKPD